MLKDGEFIWVCRVRKLSGVLILYCISGMASNIWWVCKYVLYAGHCRYFRDVALLKKNGNL
jgi:hypothetical protein